ncbi:Uncharacterised protein [Serratia quinivorans]|uniref:hypothetical protein n=1 Tax=Serratia quinivorans TaxID=137545 RepID=UPI000F6C767F|nr:hypothetical protein [Serratia quinivorans]VEI68083.1 Uncharacterised protein [Serratia quinivorans]
MAEQDGGNFVYQVDIETAKMVTGSRQAAVVLGEMEKQANRSPETLLPRRCVALMRFDNPVIGIRTVG